MARMALYASRGPGSTLKKNVSWVLRQKTGYRPCTTETFVEAGGLMSYGAGRAHT